MKVQLNEHFILWTVLCLVSSAASSECPDDYMMINDSCFQYVTDLQYTWLSAKFKCRELGGELVKINDCLTFADLVAGIHLNSYDEPDVGFWVGASDDALEGYWLWADLSTVNLGTPFWGVDSDGVFLPSGGAERNCAQMHPDQAYYLSDANCSNLNKFICETSPIEIEN